MSEIIKFPYDISDSNLLELAMDNSTKDYAKSSLYQLQKKIDHWNIYIYIYIYMDWKFSEKIK
jgi:hypothetical protein